MPQSAPRSVYVLVTGLSLTALAAMAAAPSAGIRADVSWWVLVPLSATLVLGGVLQLDTHHRGHRVSLDLFEAAMLPLLTVLAGPGAVAVAAVTKLASQRLLRVEGLKTAFNVAQWSAATAVASLVYLHVRDGIVGQTAGLVLAMVAALALNHLSVVAVLALVQRRRYSSVLTEITASIVPGWFIGAAINVSFGLLFATVVVVNPELSVLFLVPLGVLGWAQRSYSEVVVNHSRLEALHEATRHLGTGESPADTLPQVLESIRAAFASAAVGVLVGDSLRVHAGDPDLEELAALISATADVPSVERYAAGDGSAVGTLLSSHNRRTSMVAPLLCDGEAVGNLVSIDRGGVEGFDTGELSLFEALAGEIANALERADLHRALERERARLFEIVDGSSDGIFTVDVDGLIVDWNPAMEQITGFSVDVARGGHVAALLRPRTADDSEVPFDRWSTESLAVLPEEFTVLTRSGEPRTIAPSYAETTGEMPSLVVVARDVTRQRELDRLRDDFVATVSHELLTPLTSIVGFSSMLLDPPRPLSDRDRNAVALRVRKGARRLERLVANLLEVSRFQAGGLSSPAPVDLKAACEHAIDEQRQAFPDREILFDTGSGGVLAIGNQLSVEQILANLLGNALKYAPEGPVEVACVERPGSLTVTVTDHGPGIPPEAQDKVFDRFHRVDQHVVQPGTGIGLYISRQLAMAMEGTLTLQSEPGQGCTFSLTLPARLRLVAVS